MNSTQLNNQQTVDFLYNLLNERFNQVSTFRPFKGIERATNGMNCFHKDTRLGAVTVSVVTFDEIPNDESEYTRIVSFAGKHYQF